MSSIIYYFSGTGNSLSAARQIGENIGEKVNLLAIQDFVNSNSIEITDDVVGLVFPVHYLSVTGIVKKFVERMNFKSKPYIFAAVTCNSVSGRCIFDLKDLLAQRGQQLSAGFTVLMPGNAIIDTPEVQQQKLIESRKRLLEISGYIKNRIFGTYEATNMKYEDLPKDEQMRITPDMFWSNQECNSCGTCSRVCPNKNICISVEEKPVWGSNCTTCFACFHWCPRKAVNIGQISSFMPQYRNPDISLEELID
jgi:formate hydrogenlyase subunit 6/NADH:ubiquinone oxidoreductase subunit I